jgi:hypothetical protein
MTAITETPAHRAILDTLTDAHRIRLWGVSDAGRYYIRLNNGRRVANLTVTRAADFAAALSA